MPPKPKGKDKGKGKKKKPDTEPEPELVFDDSDEEVTDMQFDLLNDLNEKFFSKASKIIQTLMQRGRNVEAATIKRYVDLLFRVHRRYSEEVKKNEELIPQISIAENKLRIALELTANSEETMQHLKEALDDAWKESDASLLREEDIQEKFQEVLMKCEKFESKETEKQDDTAEFGHLSKYKNIILRERDRINGEVIDLEKRLQMQRYYSESLEYVVRNNDDSITKMTTQIRVLDSEKQNLEVKMRLLQNHLDEQKDISAKTVFKLDQTLKELSDVHNRLQGKTADVDRLKLVVEKLRNDNSLHMKQIAKNDDEITLLRKEAKIAEETIRGLRLEDQMKANLISQLTNKYKKVSQDHSVMSSKVYKLNRTINHLNEDLVRLKNQSNALEKDLLNSAQKYDDLRRLKDNIQRERDNLRSDIIKLNNHIADLKHTIMIQTNTIDVLHLDINKLNVKLDEAKISISKAEKERDEMAQEMESLHEKIEYYQEQLQFKTNQVTDLSEKLQQKQSALINMKKQLESVHSEKMILQRNLETCTQERDNYKVLQTKTAHQITQLTNEISTNQHKINLLNLRIERLNNEKKDLQTELKNRENMLANVRKDLKEMKHKNENLMKTIFDDELKFIKLTQELEETRKEKNLIGLQMVRRNDEIVLLKEKLSITQTALDQGQTQYNQRIEDIRLLKTEITNLRTERDCLSRALKSTANMRSEIIRLQRLLTQERVRVRCLMEDAKTPTGVHRWRILKGEDPGKFELLAKVQMLQRRNLRQEVDKLNLSQNLEESKKVCESLKRVIENLPSNNVKQKLVETQRINKRQMKKLKALNAELMIDKIELHARECIIEQFKATLKVTKQRLCDVNNGIALPDSAPESIHSHSSDKYADCTFAITESSEDNETSGQQSEEPDTNDNESGNDTLTNQTKTSKP